jgi:PBP1b-binding outer membrane lipoprotein LpoB
MKNKTFILSIVLALFLGTTLIAGCAPKKTPTPTPAPSQTTPPETTPDVTTTASIVDNADAFQKAISSTGTWIIAITKDLTVDKDLVVEGEFKKWQEG